MQYLILTTSLILTNCSPHTQLKVPGKELQLQYRIKKSHRQLMRCKCSLKRQYNTRIIQLNEKKIRSSQKELRIFIKPSWVITNS